MRVGIVANLSVGRHALAVVESRVAPMKTINCEGMTRFFSCWLLTAPQEDSDP